MPWICSPGKRTISIKKSWFDKTRFIRVRPRLKLELMEIFSFVEKAWSLSYYIKQEIMMVDKKTVNAIVVKYQKPDLKRCIWQMINSFVPYLISWYIMVLSLSVSYWLTLVLAIPAAGFLIRIFIIFHDCGHGSFFKSSRANHFWGTITGILTFTPYYEWRHSHAVHHATAGDLDKVGPGSVLTLTVEEYKNASNWRKIKYRIYRNPLIMFTIGALFNFLVLHRFTSSISTRKDRQSVHLTNLAVLVLAVLLSILMGFKVFLLVQLPIIAFASTFGVWLFYLQHQFEGVYWARHDKWNRIDAALKGSSLYKLPKVLQWFSGNIGFHHIHHLNPLIPNYYLEKCHNENPIFHDVKALTLVSAFKCFFLRLYDEAAGKLVGYP
jgi:omega-6 fatty acid desaturase (delta-12 desaturase)